MRKLTSNEMKQVAGAAIIINGITVHVPANGIPAAEFANIEYALQMGFDGYWNQPDIEDYLAWNVSYNHVETYLQSMIEAILEY
jgi:hypothetical protein